MFTENAFPVADTEADIFESEILFVDTVADVNIGAPFKVAVPFKAVTPPALTVKLLTVAVPLTLKLVPIVVPPFKVAPFATTNPWFIFVVDPLTVKPVPKVPAPAAVQLPANVPKPVLETVNKLVPPVFNVKAVPPVATDALTTPLAILDKFNPVIPDAGILNKLAPDPENKVADDVPKTVRLPNISVEPVN